MKVKSDEPDVQRYFTGAGTSRSPVVAVGPNGPRERSTPL
jgi:hypothetical protein